jgi:tripartite-type tricarboxylate transporter receptor subunit TctC
MIRNTLFIATLSLAAAAAVAQPAYPARTVRIIVPYPPGGGNDIIARALGEELAQRLGQTFIVDNRAGGSTIIGTELAMRAAPDGYTVLVASQTTFAIVPNVRPRVPYDPVNDFAPVSLLATQPYIIVVHPSLPVRSVKELIALAKKQPGKLLFASASTGSGSHLYGEMFKAQTGVDMTHIPYKGSGPAVTDLLGGQVSLMFSTASTVITQVAAKKLRAIAITTPQRHPSLPALPTAAETLPGFEALQWIGMHAPRATPGEAIGRLNAAIAATAKSPAYRSRMATQGYDAASSTPQQLTARVQSEFARFGKLVRAIGLKG